MISVSSQLSNLFNKTDEFAVFRKYLQQLHYEWQIVVPPADVFNLKMVQHNWDSYTDWL